MRVVSLAVLEVRLLRASRKNVDKQPFQFLSNYARYVGGAMDVVSLAVFGRSVVFCLT